MEGQVSISQIQLKRVPIGRFGRRAEPCSHSTALARCTGVPWWTVVTAGAAPVLLVIGFLVAAMLQPVSYDSLRDTISALAARGAADPWVMTAAIAAVGACYLGPRWAEPGEVHRAPWRLPPEASRPCRLPPFRRRFTATPGRTLLR